jgi:hypothetical protein
LPCLSEGSLDISRSWLLMLDIQYHHQWCHICRLSTTQTDASPTLALFPVQIDKSFTQAKKR